jgi:hypothetical protein
MIGVVARTGRRKRDQEEVGMRLLNSTTAFVLIALFLIATGLSLVQHGEEIDLPRPRPGTFPLRNQRAAVAVGRQIAVSELASGARARDVNLDRVELLTGLDKEGIYRNDPVFKTRHAIWIVTFRGLFSPQRDLGETKPVYTTLTVRLFADTGSVLGVEMRR